MQLQALRQLEILDTPSEPRFDRITAIVQQDADCSDQRDRQQPAVV